MRDNKKAGVFEPAISKIKSLKFATEVSNIKILITMFKLAEALSTSKVFLPYFIKMTFTFAFFQAAITILRIDDLIKLEPEKGEEKSYQQAYQDGSLEG